MKEKERRSRCLMAVGVIIASLGIAALVGCATQSTDMASTQGPDGEVAREAPTYQEIIEMFPNEYNSAMTHKTDEEGEDNSHAGFQELMETPAVRDEGGAILEVVEEGDPRKTEIQVSCLSCKASAVNEFFEDEGYGVFDPERVLGAEDIKALDGRYWDCYGCHNWNGTGLDTTPNMIYANEKVFAKQGAFFKSLAPKEAVCGQCHNFSSARKAVSSADEANNYDIYSDGCDADTMFEMKYATATRDEAAGVYQAWINHPQIETFQNSIHQSMGLGCVDCHMPMVTDESGNEYRQHNASGSVYENDAAMEFCLTCHKTQNNISTIDEMRTFLKGEQDAQKEKHLEVKAALEGLYDKLVEQTANPTVDEVTLEKARENYSRAYFYMEWQQGNRFDPIDGAEIAHDPQEFKSLLSQALTLVDEAEALIA